MLFIKKMKIQLQRNEGKVLMPETKKQSNTISGMLNPNFEDKTKNAKLVDGYWMILQDWSMCTLKCGGGKSYLQRMCVPPKEGGKPCVGEAILTKECNKEPCPTVGVSKNPNEASTVQKTMKPIVKVMPFSSKPQRYTKCVIKESDMMYTKQMEGGASPVQLPVRVIMNNRTLTIYAGEDFESHLDSFNILKSNFVNEEKADSSCFWINSEDHRKAHLCPFGCASNTKVVEEWRYDFNLFKYQCNYGHKEQELDVTLQKKLEQKIASAKASLIEEAQTDVKKRAQITEEKKLATTVQKVNAVALQAIQKELNMEELIKNEEKEREVKVEEEINQKIAIEQEKEVNYFYIFIKFLINLEMFYESN
jgi:hypothetical protein